MPESVKRRGSSGPTIGAIVGFSSRVAIGVKDMGRRSIRRVKVTVRLFASCASARAPAEVELDLPEGARVSDALRELEGVADGLPLVMAVNREYAREDSPLDPGDELALIPPVSGGAGTTSPWARVTAEPLSLDALAARVRDPRAGAVVTFQGVTREVE